MGGSVRTVVAATLLVGVFVGHANAQSDAGVRMQPSPYCDPHAVGCSLHDVDFEYHHDAFAGAGFDTGWVPSSGAIQLRFALGLAGSTDVSMGGSVVTQWPAAIDTQVRGRPGTGHLAMNYGVVLQAQLRFSATILGAHYGWEGDIPIGSGLSDLAAIADTTFDPFALPGDILRPVTISDSSARFRLLSYDLAGSFVSIPGLSGGLAIEVQGNLATSYLTSNILIAGADPIVETDGNTRIYPAEGTTNFGAATDVVVQPNGNLSYDGTISIFPTVFVSLLGFDFNYDITEIPIHFGAGGMDVAFPEDTAHVPLPDIDFSVTAVDFGTVEPALTEHRPLTIANAGEAPLEIMPRRVGGGFNATRDTLVINPGESTDLDVTFLSTVGGHAAANLQLDTNDPDRPLIVVRLTADVPETDAGTDTDAGVDDGGVIGRPPQTGGCGCDVAGTHASSAWTLIALALLVIPFATRNRRRRLF